MASTMAVPQGLLSLRKSWAAVLAASCMIVCGSVVPASSAMAGDAANPLARRGQTTDDQRRIWNFDAEKTGEAPAGFAASRLGEGPPSRWRIELDPQSPSPANRLSQEASCSASGCLHVLLFEGMAYDYPDITVRLRTVGEGSAATGGIVFAAQDARNFYAALVDLSAESLELVRVVNGEVMVIGREPAKRKPTTWHFLRAQHNTNLSKDYVEISFDGQVLFSTWDTNLNAGRIGLVTRGDTPVAFDNLFAIQLFSQRPLSPPAPY